MALRVNPFQPLIDAVPKPFRNVYILVSVCFFVWMLLFDKHDVLTQFSLQGAINKLEEDKIFYQEKIEDTRQDQADLEQNAEKYARERYYMSRSDEDVYIIEKK